MRSASGAGIVLHRGIGYFVFGKSSTLPPFWAVDIPSAALLVIHLFSNSSTH